MQRASSSGDMAADIMLGRDRMDVRERATTLDVPTLVAHARDDHMVAHQNGLELATLIPDATLLTLDSSNHLLLDEPAWNEFVSAVADFLGSPVRSRSTSSLRSRPSGRELEILRLVSDGRSNEEIAARLHLSIRTVERHLGNLYRKLDLSGKSARAAAAALLPEIEAAE